MKAFKLVSRSITIKTGASGMNEACARVRVKGSLECEGKSTLLHAIDDGIKTLMFRGSEWCCVTVISHPILSIWQQRADVNMSHSSVELLMNGWMSCCACSAVPSILHVKALTVVTTLTLYHIPYSHLQKGSNTRCLWYLCMSHNSFRNTSEIILRNEIVCFKSFRCSLSEDR